MLVPIIKSVKNGTEVVMFESFESIGDAVEKFNEITAPESRDVKVEYVEDHNKPNKLLTFKNSFGEDTTYHVQILLFRATAEDLLEMEFVHGEMEF